MTDEYMTQAEVISYLSEHKLDKGEQSSVNRCLAKKGHAPSKQDVAICIRESRPKKSKMTEKKKEVDFIIKKDRKVVTFDRKEIQGTGFKTLPVKKSKYVKTKDG